MTTITKDYQTSAGTFTRDFNVTKPATLSLLARYNNYIESIKFSHFGIMAMTILIGSCLGSISAMFIFLAGGPIWMFAIGLFATLGNLVAAISQSPTRWMVGAFAISVIINTALLIAYALLV